MQHESKFADAEVSFKEALKLEPVDGETHFRLAQVLLSQGKAQDAESEVKLALLLKPNETSYHKLLADSLLQEKKYDAALCEYRTTIELNPTGPDAGDIKNKMDYLKQVLNLR